MTLTILRAAPDDALAISDIRNAAALDLTARFGTGHWSSLTTPETVLRHIAASRMLIARDDDDVHGALRLATKKPWAIDPAYFTAVRKVLYLVDMAVLPTHQRSGVGRQLLAAATALARADGFEAIRLDAYDADAGAAGFYARCGYRETGRAVYRKVPLVYFELVL
jgi:GNAT superfamily N-acetyltransferase